MVVDAHPGRVMATHPLLAHAAPDVDGQPGVKQRVRDRRWVVVVVVTALLGAVAAAIWADSVAPGQRGVIVSLAVAGFGLGGVVGVLASVWMRPHREPVMEFDPLPPEGGEEIEPPPAQPTALTDRGSDADAGPVESQVRAQQDQSPAPAGGAPGWYSPEQGGGERRFWDGERWTDHVWRERAAGSRRSARRGDRSSR